MYGRRRAVTVNCLNEAVGAELAVVVVVVPLTSVELVSVMPMSCGMRPSLVMNSATSRCFSVCPVNVTSAAVVAPATATAPPGSIVAGTVAVSVCSRTFSGMTRLSSCSRIENGTEDS